MVMEILGDSQISLTMNTYSHVVPTLQQEAASRMDEMLSWERYSNVTDIVAILDACTGKICMAIAARIH